MEEFDNIEEDESGAIVYNRWIEWEHIGIPNKPDWLRLVLGIYTLC